MHERSRRQLIVASATPTATRGAQLLKLRSGPGWISLLACTGCATVLMLVGCGGMTHEHPRSHTGNVSRISRKPSTSGAQPAPTTHVISLAKASHDVPPAGVKAQLEWIVGGGASFQADCSGVASASAKLALSWLPYNGASDTANPLLGESFVVCATGFRPSESVNLTLTRPDGQ